MTQQVYILEDKNSGLLKVGISVDVVVRVGQVNQQFGCDAEVIGVLDVNDARKTERFIHGMLEDCRVVGEWFEVDDSRQDYLLAYFDTPIPTRKRINQRGKTAATANESEIRRKLEETMQDIGADVKKALREQGRTQADLARKLGMKPSNLSNMLNGKISEVPRRWQEVLDEVGLELTVKPKDPDGES